MAFSDYILVPGTPGDDDFDGSEDRDLMVGSTGNDKLRGRTGDDFLMGNKGADNLRGNRGDDILLGGHGDDVIRGGRDSDLLDGGYGSDNLQGDNDRFAGSVDTFWFDVRTAGFENKSGDLASDTIMDFEAGIDVLWFTGFDRQSDRIFTQDGADVIVALDVDGDGFADYDLVTVLNANVADVLAASADGVSPLL